MNRMLNLKSLLAATVACGALAAASTAHARTDVYLSLGVPVAPVYVEPQPVYVQPQPVYVQPRTVYVQPEPVYYQGYRHGHGHRRGPWGDADRDGVPNRYDRAPGNPYRY